MGEHPNKYAIINLIFRQVTSLGEPATVGEERFSNNDEVDWLSDGGLRPAVDGERLNDNDETLLIELKHCNHSRWCFFYEMHGKTHLGDRFAWSLIHTF